MVKLFYDSTGIILEAYDGAIPTPEKYYSCRFLQVTDDVWNTAQGKENRVVDGVLVSTPIVPPEKTVFTKLAIRRACRTLGLEGKLNALLASSDVFRADWTDAQDIDLADPVLLQALQAGTFSEEEINSIKNSLQ